MFKKMIVFLMALMMTLTCCCAALAADYTFEAECVDLTYLSGHGWSNEVSGAGLLIKDKYNAGASNGYALGYLYEYGNEVEFWINASEAVEGVTLYLRCSMESKQTSEEIPWDWMEIRVISLEQYQNDEEVDPIEYPTMTFSGIPGLITIVDQLLPFANKRIGKIDLAEGENLIQIRITNNVQMQGTMQATAPIFDCIILKTDADVELTWAEGYPMNLDVIEALRAQ